MYSFLLFDADNTLFDFDYGNLAAFHTMSQRMRLPDTPAYFEIYKKIDSALWDLFNKGEISKEELLHQLFRQYLAQIHIDRDPDLCLKILVDKLSQNTLLCPNVEEVISELSKTYHIYIITNAVSEVHRKRLAESKIAPYIKDTFISDEAGVNKPDPAFFDYVFSKIPGITKDNCLVIGDSLTSDIFGAKQYGLHSCWYNRNHLPQGDIRADYEIDDIALLPSLLK